MLYLTLSVGSALPSIPPARRIGPHLLKIPREPSTAQSLLKRQNETGLEILSRAHLHLDKLSAEFGKALPSGKDKDIKTVVAKCVEDFKAIVADFDIKPSDVEKLLNAVDEVDRAFTKAGHDGVIKLAQRKLKSYRTCAHAQTGEPQRIFQSGKWSLLLLQLPFG